MQPVTIFSRAASRRLAASGSPRFSGKKERTQQAYLRAVRKFSEFLKLTPDLADEDALRRYLLFVKNDKAWSSSSLNVAYNGIKFFYRVTCPRDWQTLRTLRVTHERKLPELPRQQGSRVETQSSRTVVALLLLHAHLYSA